MTSHETALYEYEGIQKALEAGGLPLEGEKFLHDHMWAGAHFLRIHTTLYTTGLKSADAYADLAEIAESYLNDIDTLKTSAPLTLDAGTLMVRFLRDEEKWSIGFIGRSQMIQVPVRGYRENARENTVNLGKSIDPEAVVYGYVEPPRL